MESILVYYRANKLVRLLMAMVSHSLGSHELQRFREEFQIIDRHILGSVSFSDFNRAFASTDTLSGSTHDLKSIFLAVSQGSKCISYHSYIAASMHNRLSETPSTTRLSLIFSYLDQEDKGKINPENIRK